VRAGAAKLLMKGSLHPDELMSAVVSSETGLRTERRISHAYVMDVPRHPTPLTIRDPAMNIQPSLPVTADNIPHAIEPATERRISHAYVMDVPGHPPPLIITDAAINIEPSLLDKADIIRNAIDLAHVLGIETPRVAILSAVETINPAMRSTLDAAALCKMAERGQRSEERRVGKEWRARVAPHDGET